MKKIIFFCSFLSISALLAQAPQNGLVAFYGFQNNYASQNNTYAFTNASTTATQVPFVSGKYGQGVSFSANGQYLVNTTLGNIIAENTDITIAFWQKPSNVADQYKTTFELFGSLFFRNFNGQNEVGVNSTFQNFHSGGVGTLTASDYGNWKHYAITTRTINGIRYLTILVDGVFSNNVAFPALYQFTSKATIGTGTDVAGVLMNSKRFSGVIDEFYMYNRSMTNAEILLVMNESTLSSKSVANNTLIFSMFPNPANNLLNINMENELKSVEIYSLQGQKILSATEKSINISGLSTGMYMVRVQDVDGGVATQKLVKE